MPAGDHAPPLMQDRPRRVQTLISWLGLVTGVGILATLTLSAGLDDVIATFEAGGPALLLLVGFHVFQVLPHAAAWACVFPPGERPHWPGLIPAMWIGQSINFLLPVANVGGDLIRPRLIVPRLSTYPAAIASVIADKTTQALTAVVLLAAGVALLAAQAADGGLIAAAAVAAALLAAGAFGFIRLQRSRAASTITAKLAGAREGRFARFHAGTREVEGRLAAIYDQPRVLVLAVTIRFASAVLLALEVWAAAALIGLELSVIDAVTLRVVGFAIRSAAFFVWGGLGIQEGAFAAIGAIYGLPPAELIAISLATRVREIAVAVPGVSFWLTVERRRMRHGRSSGA